MPQDRIEQRHEVQKQGRYRTGNGMARDVMVTDLSTRGCRFFDRFCNLSPGAILTIRVGNIGPLEAQVRWVENFTVGVRFETPIHASVLDHMRNTIEGWHTPRPEDRPPLFLKPGEQPVEQPATVDATFNLSVRPATVADVRAALLDAGFTLPINSHADLVEVFHRVLDKVAAERT